MLICIGSGHARRGDNLPVAKGGYPSWVATALSAFDPASDCPSQNSRATRTDRTLSLDRLTQLVLRNQLSADLREIWSTVAVTVLNAVFIFDKDDVNTWLPYERLLLHTQSAMSYSSGTSRYRAEFGARPPRAGRGRLRKSGYFRYFPPSAAARWPASQTGVWRSGEQTAAFHELQNHMGAPHKCKPWSGWT